MKFSRLAFYVALCSFGVYADAADRTEAHIVIPGAPSSRSSSSDDTRNETRQEARARKAAEHQKKVDYYRSKYDPCDDTGQGGIRIDAMFDDVDLSDIKCTKNQAAAAPEKNNTAAEKKKVSSENSKVVAEKKKPSPEPTKVAAEKSKAEPEKKKPQDRKVYSYTENSTFKSPVGAKTQEEALNALNKQIDEAEQRTSKPFLDHISGKISNRPAPTCKQGEYQKLWRCESTVTFTGQTYADPAKAKQAKPVTRVQER